MSFKYEIVVHTFYNKEPMYVNEVYKRMDTGELRFVYKDEANKIPNNHPNKEVFELVHSENYEKVKSPFKDENSEDLYLYGRYINISNRRNDCDARF